jgi:hypothetical protein
MVNDLRQTDNNKQLVFKKNRLLSITLRTRKSTIKKVSFEEEYRKFLIENGIDIDE